MCAVFGHDEYVEPRDASYEGLNLDLFLLLLTSHGVELFHLLLYIQRARLLRSRLHRRRRDTFNVDALSTSRGCLGVE